MSNDTTTTTNVNDTMVQNVEQTMKILERLSVSLDKINSTLSSIDSKLNDVGLAIDRSLESLESMNATLTEVKNAASFAEDTPKHLNPHLGWTIAENIARIQLDVGTMKDTLPNDWR